MYVEKQAVAAARELEQGDLLNGFLLPDLVSAAALMRHPARTTTVLPLQPDAVAKEPIDDMRLVVGVRLVDVLVVANSCDMAGGGAVAVVPVGPLKLDADPTKPKAYPEIRRRATSATWTKSFYLGASARHGVAVRSEARLAQLHTLAPDYVDLQLQHRGVQRKSGLNADGVAHLRWALGFFFGRNSRELSDWLTDEDLLLCIAYHQSIDAAKRDEAELAAALAEAGKRGLSTDRR